jgi:fructokinase
VITVAGEALLDILLDDTGAVTAFPGGGPFNVARMIARLGGSCQFLGRIGDDAVGRRLRKALEEPHVGLAVPSPTAAPTSLAVAELDHSGHADYTFYLDGTSAAELSPEDVPADVFDATTAIALGGLGILAEPIASTLRRLVPTASERTTVLLDPNCRPRAVKDPARQRAAVEGFLDRADIVKVSVDDLRLLDPHADVRAAARRFLELGPAAVLVTNGPAPVTIHTTSSERGIPVPEVRLVDTVGAGDAFVAAFLTWWTDNECAREHVADAEALAEATAAAVTVARAACTAAGANLPETFRWLRSRR